MPQIPGINQNAPPMPVMEAPVVWEIVLHSCAVRCADMPDGGKLLRFNSPNGMAVTIPLDKNGAELVIQRLKGSDISIVRGGVL